MNEYFKYLGVGLHAVYAAQSIMLAHYGKPLDFNIKEDGSPVTTVDKLIEKEMKKILGDAFPDHGFIGEEYGRHNQTARLKWVIDPADGTNNLIRGIPICGTLLALMENNEIVLGISNIPAMHELAYAVKGGGAFINGERVYVSKTAKLSKAYGTFGGENYFTQYGYSSALNIIPKLKRHRAYGDLFGYTLVASGKFDFNLTARAKIYDVAPAIILIEEAGGKVTDLDGKPITTECANICASNGLLHDEILSHIYKENASL